MPVIRILIIGVVVALVLRWAWRLINPPDPSPQVPTPKDRHGSGADKASAKPKWFATGIRFLLTRETPRFAEGSRRRKRPFPALDRRIGWGARLVDSPEELIRALGIRDWRELTMLCDPNCYQQDPKAPKALRNYHVRRIPKRSGGQRVIFAPKKRLKEVQRAILRQVLDRVPAHSAAHAFRRRHGIASNATPHIGQRIVLSLDLEDFFTTIKLRRVSSFFRWMGYPRDVARLLSLLCTSRTDQQFDAKLDGFVHRPLRARYLAQGAPTSPALANALAYGLDVRLSALAKKFGVNYTRYADDLTFSGGESFMRGLRRFVPLLKKIIRAEGFRINQRKWRFARAGQRQQVTGLVVNRKLSVGREEFDLLKAILHNARRAGSLESQNRSKRPAFRQHLSGKIAHLARFHPERGAKLWAQLQAIRD